MGTIFKKDASEPKKTFCLKEGSKSPEKAKENKIGNNSNESKASQESQYPKKSTKSEQQGLSASPSKILENKVEKNKEEKKEIESNKERENIINTNSYEKIQEDEASTEKSISGYSSNDKGDIKEKEDLSSQLKGNNLNNIDEINTLIFPIVSFKKQEECKNSELDSLSALNNALSTNQLDFYNMNLEIPQNLSKINNISSQLSSAQSSIGNSMENSSLSYFSNNFFNLNPLHKIHKGRKHPQNFRLSYFVPVTFSCSLNTHNVGKYNSKYVQDEKEFFSKIIKIADVENISEFWQVFQHMKQPNQCPVGTEYHIFKKGIVPMWEDNMNKEGGKLTVLLTFNYSNLIWEEVAFNFCKGLLPFYGYINGIVISARQKFLILSFWIKTKNNHIVEKIRFALGNLLQTPSSNCFDFIAFN